MENFKVDLTNCDREPIHLLGKIQSFGFLAGINLLDKTLTYVSDNIGDLFKTESRELLGKHFTALFTNIQESHGRNIAKLIEKNLTKTQSKLDQFFDIEINGVSYYLILSISNEELIVEFEECFLKENLHSLVFESVSEIMSSDTLQELLDTTAQRIKKLIGYERVMVYRFLEDGTGRVDAEEKEDYLEPWLGLHYPESDIPKQARHLYVKSRVRLIADVNSQDVAVSAATDIPVPDMTYCVSRAVSPMHIQYLKNMEVYSSFSVSIVINDQLWGLIACHNYSPKFIDYRLRSSCKLIGNILSSFIAVKQNEESTSYTTAKRFLLDKMRSNLLTNSSNLQTLLAEGEDLINLVESSGVAICMGSEIKLLGNTPLEDEVKKIQKWMHERDENLFYTHHFVAYYPSAASFINKAAGILIVQLSNDADDMIMWFAPEYVHSVKWAGKPEKVITATEYKGQTLNEISPRKSFEAWTQLTRSTSKKWRPEDIQSVEEVAKIIFEVSHKKSKELIELNKKLKLAYSELDTFSYTVSHDLKAPLTVIKSHAQMLQYINKQQGEKEKEYLTNIVKGVDKMSYMMNEILDLSKVVSRDLEKQPVNTKEIINEIIQEVKIAYSAHDTKIKLGATPEFYGDSVMIYQLFSNLISNAVKYSQRKENPEVWIEGYDDGDKITYRVSDNGIGIDEREFYKIFQVFKRMDNALEFEGTGVGLSIVKRIMERHEGQVRFESSINEGSTFFVSFNKHI